MTSQFSLLSRHLQSASFQQNFTNRWLLKFEKKKYFRAWFVKKKKEGCNWRWVNRWRRGRALYCPYSVCRLEMTLPYTVWQKIRFETGKKRRRRRRRGKKKKFNCKYPVIISYVIRSVESKPDTWSRGVFVCWMAHNSRGGNVVSGRRTLPVTLVVCVPRPLWAIDGQLSWPTLFYVSFLAAHLVGKPHCCAIFVLHSGMVAA